MLGLPFLLPQVQSPLASCSVPLEDDVSGMQEPRPHPLWLPWAQFLAIDGGKLEGRKNKRSRYVSPSLPFLSKAWQWLHFTT